jgi:hypothetical protein
MKTLSPEKKSQLKIELSKRPELVTGFLRKPDAADNFTEITWLVLATAFAEDLKFVDENLKTVGSILKQFEEIKKWFDGQIDGKEIALGERLIALLARNLSSQKTGCSLSEMIEKTATEESAVISELKRLSDAGIVREDQGLWKFIADD